MIALSIICFGLLVICGYIFWSYSWLLIQIGMANEQTKIFDDMRKQALQSDPAEAADCLKYVVQYYPSGSKQDVGSHLDLMVERERASAIRDIIGYLRRETGEDLGENAQAWIEKY
jgi:hypothetical protein